MSGAEFVRIVEAELAKRGISKTQFYKESGISSANLSQWRTQYFPSPENIEKIEKYLGVSFNINLGEAEETREMLFENNEQRILFETSKGAPKSAMLEAAALIQRYKEMGK